MKKYDIAISVGVFDCFHEGHYELIELMDELAGEQHIFIHDDISTFENKKRFPVQDLGRRESNLLYALDIISLDNSVNRICFKDPSSSIESFIKQNKDLSMVYVRGDDWKDFPGREIIEKHNIPIHFKGYTKGVSTSQIREDLKNR